MYIYMYIYKYHIYVTQNIHMYFMPHVDIPGNMPVWSLQMNPSESMVDMYITLVVALCLTWVGTCIASSAATVRLSSSGFFFGRPWLYVLWVGSMYCVCVVDVLCVIVLCVVCVCVFFQLVFLRLRWRQCTLRVITPSSSHALIGLGHTTYGFVLVKCYCSCEDGNKTVHGVLVAWCLGWIG